MSVRAPAGRREERRNRYTTTAQVPSVLLFTKARGACCGMSRTRSSSTCPPWRTSAHIQVVRMNHAIAEREARRGGREEPPVWYPVLHAHA